MVEGVTDSWRADASLRTGLVARWRRGVALVAGWMLMLPWVAAASSTGDALVATDLRVCDKANPVGVSEAPWFGWRPVAPARDALQTAYRIQVASSLALLESGKPDVWDSGAVASNLVNAVRYGGPALAADRRYYWQVVLTDDRGRSTPAGESAWFDVGLLRNEDWAGAQWITRESTEADDYTLFRKEFDLPKGRIVRAVAYLTACHKYELWVNGEPAGKGPAYHQPQFQYYNAYDVTAALRAGGANALAVFTHWWGGGQGRPRGDRGLLVRLVVSYDNGARTVVGTDGTWRQRRAEQWELGMPKRNRTNGIGFVEKIHADRIVTGWQNVGFDDATWALARVRGAHPTPPWTGVLKPDLTRVVETQHEVVGWTKLGENHYLADFGKVRAGYPVVEFPAWPEPGTVLLRGGYTLEPTGGVSLRTAQKTDLSYQFVHDGKARQFRPAEYLGMRYVEIQNAPPGLDRAAVHFVSRYYELASPAGGQVATFKSSHPTLDRVWQLMVDSIPVCTQEEFIDTPTREKGGFLADAWSESVAAMIALGDRPMTRRVLGEYLDSQTAFWSEEGRLNDVYPYDHKEDIPDYTQMYLLWVWDYYRETGDRAFLAENYERLLRIAEYVRRSRHPETGLIHNLEGGKGDYLYGIVDWPKSMRYGYDMSAAARTVVNAWAWADFDVMAQIARVLGRGEDAARFDRDAANLRDAMNLRLVDADGRYTDGLKADGTLSPHLSQQANMLPLAYSLVPAARRETVLGHIKQLRMSSGMVTVRGLVEAIGEAGDGAHLVELFTNETWDGWAKSLARGATCTWESWNAIDGNESLSHAWGAIGLVGYARYILGVSPIEPQHARIRVRPLHFGAALTSAEGSLPTDRGPVYVAWKRGDDRRLKMQVTLPDAMTAEIWVPALEGSRLLRNGKAVDARRAGNYLVVDAGPGTATFEAR